MTSWIFWFGILFAIIFVLWIFHGGKEHEFVGLDYLRADAKLMPEKFDREAAEKILRLRRREKVEKGEKIEKIEKEEKVEKEIPPSSPPPAASPPPVSFEQDQGYRQRSRGESICKKCLEYWFKVPFYSDRSLPFLKNPKTKNNLELDCFNKDFRLAVEYNGVQHYEYPNRFMKTEEEFKEQRFKDDFKKKQCEKNGVHLIIVPFHVKEPDIPDFIRQRLPDHLRPLAHREPVF